MRKRYRVLWLAAIVAAVIVPFGFALSLEPAAIVRTEAPASIVAVSSAAPVVLDIRHHAPPLSATLPFKTGISDSARLFLLGTVLIGLAIAVRRAS
jgi:hypothetical protein